MQAEAVSFCHRCLHFNFHACHVDAGRTLVFAPFARDAEFHGFGHLLGGERIRSKLAGDCETKRIGAPARQVLFLAGGAKRRAHDPALQLAAGPVVVAHLDSALKAAAAARPSRPVQFGVKGGDRVIRAVAEQAPVVHSGWVNDFAGVEQSFRIKVLLDLFKVGCHARPEHLLMEFRSHHPVAVFAGVRTFVSGHKIKTLLGDCPHCFNVFVQFEVQNRSHMQASYRGVGVPCALGPVSGEDIGQPSGILGKIRQFDGTVFYKRNRFPLVLHRHHDVETGFSKLRNGALQAGIGHSVDSAPIFSGARPGKAQIAHHVFELFQL